MYLWSLQGSRRGLAQIWTSMRTCLDQTGANFKSRFPGMAGGGFCCPGCVSCDCVERTSAAWLCEDPAEGAVIGSGGGGLLKF